MKRYAIKQLNRPDAPYVIGIHNQHLCCVSTNDPNEAKTWRSAAPAQRWMDLHANAGYGLNVPGAEVVEVEVDRPAASFPSLRN